jgi:hypothetical protein
MREEHKDHPAYQINFKRIFIRSTMVAFAIVGVVLCLGVLVAKLVLGL